MKSYWGGNKYVHVGITAIEGGIEVRVWECSSTEKILPLVLTIRVDSGGGKHWCRFSLSCSLLGSFGFLPSGYNCSILKPITETKGSWNQLLLEVSVALHLPTTEQWLIYGSCLEARQPSTRIIHETVLRKVGQEYICILPCGWDGK